MKETYFILKLDDGETDAEFNYLTLEAVKEAAEMFQRLHPTWKIQTFQREVIETPI